MTHNVPVQSLIDHIKTAIDVDPWAKEMAEDLLKEREKQKFFVDENGKITPLPVVVLCKDCKHRPIKPNDYENGFDLEFPDNKCPCQNGDDGWYSWYPADNWYCADGERGDPDDG
jgi:hypothetical protein